MTRYLVKLRASTAVHAEHLQQIEAPGVRVMLTNWIATDAVGQAHRGLFFDVVTEAADLNDAYRWAINRANLALTIFSFAMASGSSEVELLAAYWAGDEDWCEVAQWDRLPLGPFARRLADPSRVTAVFAKLDALPEGSGERIVRAMSWYQRSVEDANPLDQLSSAWLGLEAINPLLKARAGLPDEEPGRECPKCHEVVMMAATSAGIRDVLTRHQDGLWKLANGKRVAIMHGTKPFSEIHPDLPTIAANVRAALRRGVLALLSLDDADRAPFDHEPIPTPQSHRSNLRYALRGRTLNSRVVGQSYPRLTVRRIEGTRFRGVDGRTNEQASTEWEPTDFTGEWIFRSIGMQTFRDPEDAAATTTINRMTHAPREPERRGEVE